MGKFKEMDIDRKIREEESSWQIEVVKECCLTLDACSKVLQKRNKGVATVLDEVIEKLQEAFQ